MKKNIFVGITPTINEIKDENPFNGYSFYVNTYISQILKNHAIPICLNYDNDDVVFEQLQLCDCFILPGNCVIRPQIFKIIKYAYDNKIPLLGICLGMQELAIFSYLNDNNSLKELENKVLYKLNNNCHHLVSANIKHLKKSFHKVELLKKSFLYNCFKKRTIKVYSFHDYAIKNVSSLFKVVGKSLDGVIEAIESTDSNWFCIGLQFHPELQKNSKIINKFIDKVKRDYVD